jgi:hypothetical protein
MCLPTVLGCVNQLFNPKKKKTAQSEGSVISETVQKDMQNVIIIVLCYFLLSLSFSSLLPVRF